MPRATIVPTTYTTWYKGNIEVGLDSLISVLGEAASNPECHRLDWSSYPDCDITKHETTIDVAIRMYLASTWPTPQAVPDYIMDLALKLAEDWARYLELDDEDAARDMFTAMCDYWADLMWQRQVLGALESSHIETLSMKWYEYWAPCQKEHLIVKLFKLRDAQDW